jgi:hypothetical protein
MNNATTTTKKVKISITCVKKEKHMPVAWVKVCIVYGVKDRQGLDDTLHKSQVLKG